MVKVLRTSGPRLSNALPLGLAAALAHLETLDDAALWKLVRRMPLGTSRPLASLNLTSRDQSPEQRCSAVRLG